MRSTIAILALLSLTACFDDKPSCDWQVNQIMRRQIFKDCLSLAQKQPNSTKYNDAAEVVDECESAAYKQSLERICK